MGSANFDENGITTASVYAETGVSVQSYCNNAVKMALQVFSASAAAAVCFVWEKIVSFFYQNKNSRQKIIIIFKKGNLKIKFF